MLRSILFSLLFIAVSSPLFATDYTSVYGTVVYTDDAYYCGGDYNWHTCYAEKSSSNSNPIGIYFGGFMDYAKMAYGNVSGYIVGYTRISGVSCFSNMLPYGSYYTVGAHWQVTGGTCPSGWTCRAEYEVGSHSGTDYTTTGHTFDFTPTEMDSLRFAFTFYNARHIVGCCCNYYNCTQYRFVLHTPAPVNLYSYGSGAASYYSYPGTNLSIGFADSPGGGVTVTKVYDYPPSPPADPINYETIVPIYFDINTNLPEGTFSANLKFLYIPANLPEAIVEEDLTFLRWDEEESAWQIVPSYVDLENTELVAEGVEEFSFFVLGNVPTIGTENSSWGNIKKLNR